MNCRWTNRRLNAYLDGRLSALERLAVAFHLKRCDACFESYDEVEATRSPLSDLVAAEPPVELRANIRAAIAAEIAHEGWFDRAWARWRMAAREMMRPIAIRGVGGAVTAAILFAAIMPDLAVSRQQFPDDVPLTYLAKALVSKPSIVAASHYQVGSEVTVLAYIDMQGGAYDFDLPEEFRHDKKLRAEVANALLFTSFEPATKFGQPIPGKVAISFAPQQRYTVRG